MGSKKDHAVPVAGVSLRPNDPLAKKLASTGVETHNVLVKVTVPKRTGRKRKRGSNEPWVEASPSETQSPTGITGADLVQRLHDNADRYTMRAVGVIEDTHRFRNLPDFEVRADEVQIMRDIRDHAMKPDYDALKTFHVDRKSGFEDITAFPGPPSFAPTAQPYVYEYQQTDRSAPGADKSVTVRNGESRPPLVSRVLRISLAGEGVPQGPPDDIPKVSGRRSHLSKAIEALKSLLEERPVITRRVATSLRGLSYQTLTKAIPHVGYFVSSGPWRDNYVKYGVDPRSDAKYRVYQTLKYAIKDIARRQRELGYQGVKGKNHIFDGTTVEVGKKWQLCDLTDPMLQQLVHNDEVRSDCDAKLCGWYYNGTITKILVIMRDKMHRLMQGEPPLTEEEYAVLAALPCKIDEGADCSLDASRYGHHIFELRNSIRKEAKYLQMGIKNQTTTAPKKNHKLAPEAVGVLNGQDEADNAEGGVGVDEESDSDDGDDVEEARVDNGDDEAGSQGDNGEGDEHREDGEDSHEETMQD